jgi:ABC-type amino acid transport substrate-binding protein
MHTRNPAVKNIAGTVVLALILSLSLAGCGKDKPADGKKGSAETVYHEEETRTFQIADFIDKTFAILSGSSFEAVVKEAIGAQNNKYYKTPAELVDAILKGEADATLLEEPIARKFAANHPELIVLYPHVDIENYATLFSKKDDGKLRNQFNAFLQKKRDDGTYKDMVKRWIDSPKSPPMPEIALKWNTGRELIFATSDCDEPFSYKTEDGKLEGFDVEMAMRFASYLGYELKIEVMDFPDIIPAVAAGKVNFASNLFTVTNERKEIVDFSEPVYYGGTVVLTKK